jgi:RHS repeat-associated protein
LSGNKVKILTSNTHYPDWYDYGARFYDPQIGRWTIIDPKAEFYFNWSPYTYVLNTPTNAVDPSGKLIIFVNGFTSSKSEQGTSDYWRSGQVQVYPNGCNNCYQARYSFDETAMNTFDDHNAKYLDGSLGGIRGFFKGSGSSSTRSDEGYANGKEDAAAIIAGLERSGGVITESIKVFTHSMGGAYAKGYIKAILEYAKNNPELANGLKISEFDFDPFQAGDLSAIENVHTEQITHKGLIADEKQRGLDVGDNKYTEDPSSDSHSISTFVQSIQNLSEGTYKYIDGAWIKQ